MTGLLLYFIRIKSSPVWWEVIASAQVITASYCRNADAQKTAVSNMKQMRSQSLPHHPQTVFRGSLVQTRFARPFCRDRADPQLRASWHCPVWWSTALDVGFFSPSDASLKDTCPCPERGKDSAQWGFSSFPAPHLETFNSFHALYRAPWFILAGSQTRHQY